VRLEVTREAVVSVAKPRGPAVQDGKRRGIRNSRVKIASLDCMMDAEGELFFEAPEGYELIRVENGQTSP